MKTIKSLANKIWRMINKEVDYEDESKQFYVMMRLYYIITAIYILVFDIVMSASNLWKYMPILIVWLPLHLLSFGTTYRLRRRAVFHIFSVGIIVWMLFSVHLMGWGYGAQYFMYPLMVISFFATYKNMVGKLLYTVSLCLLHLAMFFYASGHEPVVPLSEGLGHGLQIMNTITLFLCMYIICLMFSNTNQAALQKLAFYNERLKQEAETDALTGLMNRRRMYAELEDRVENHANEYFAIAMGDIDFFKNVNDTKGHNCGDHVLRVVSEYFAEFMKDKGIVCRWGGEEFLFLFPNKNGDAAHEHMQTVRQHIKKLPIEYKGETIHITMTFGVEEYDFQSSITYLIKLADDKLYAGKNNGRDQVIF